MLSLSEEFLAGFLVWNNILSDMNVAVSPWFIDVDVFVLCRLRGRQIDGQSALTLRISSINSGRTRPPMFPIHPRAGSSSMLVSIVALLCLLLPRLLQLDRLLRVHRSWQALPTPPFLWHPCCDDIETSSMSPPGTVVACNRETVVVGKATDTADRLRRSVVGSKLAWRN